MQLMIFLIDLLVMEAEAHVLSDNDSTASTCPYINSGLEKQFGYGLDSVFHKLQARFDVDYSVLKRSH
jgi:hypothetical protein